MDRLIKPGDVVRNKHYTHLVYRCLPNNKGCFGYVAPSGFLGHGGVTNPSHWELAPAMEWWKSAIRYFFINLLWWLSYRTNKNLGLIGRELYISHMDKAYKSLRYPYDRAKLLFGLLPKEQLC